MNKGNNPAAISALAKGDLENFLVASTPSGIEAQEKRGQEALGASTNMPKKMSPNREALEALGFEFGDDVDDLFVSAKLPEGWTRTATEHSMHSDILDEQGRRRVGIFYKAAFYDRRADAHLVSRFRVTSLYPEGDRRIEENEMLPVVVEDAGVGIHRLGEAKYIGDWEIRDRLYEEGEVWLNENRPGWDDPVKGWSI
jgi:hypothetical protein